VEQPPAIFDAFYEIVGELGRGTTGTVYEARHTRLDRRVALKVPDLSPDAERSAKAQRFLHEEDLNSRRQSVAWFVVQSSQLLSNNELSAYRWLMEWFNACVNPSVATSRYEVVPALDPFPIYSCELDGGSGFNVYGYLPRLPDHPNLPEGQVADRADLVLAFLDLVDLKVSGIPDRHGGEMRINKLSASETYFTYESTAFRFSGVCNRAAIGAIRVLSKFAPNHREPRGPRLFSHLNVWNTCLLLLRQFGYSLHASGHPAHGDYPSRLRWHATMRDGTDLSADTPIELLGLASLHRHHKPRVDREYWWRIDGPSVLTELIDQWKERSVPK
jgi:hypothetical protein